ncbi:SUMF1/EgtB/PvdO family nonheme iron enzyme [Providencia zhijiangensis]|uniref:SUMF1/EgtB/PvdO family nonheme iron enzyme n=1 Tax=Providencia zhijiangensis TaxID=3053982 RepID=A0ABZ0MXN7_9GAMM|nr:SUMF1/EgtB/PvdO family nonheme iron enzyme [Providencia sp. D4759]WPA90881.1 SUMF1/EgtB/PvdO family nonheme iron enzyme [Providencia sp. D4759]
MIFFNQTYRTVLLISFGGLIGCDDGQKAQNAAQLREISMENMVPIPGGRFQMGDFGPLFDEKLPYSSDPSTRPLHWVSLHDFKMGKYRVTWGEFNRWLDLQGRNKTDYYVDVLNNPYAQKDKLGDDYPAQVSWQDAKAYCQWLGKVSGRKTDLPTEAQWEYAARSGGQFLIFGNSDNQMHYEQDPERNFVSWGKPVGSFAPNPIGLYDMMGNGLDWVNDWYSEDYYQHSPEDNPQGPESGEKKVTRGYHDSMDGSSTISRGGEIPDHEFGEGFRCVENL